MESNAVLIDDQPVSPTFFGESRWLTSYITPDNPDIQMLFEQVTRGCDSVESKIEACWDWVANQVKYKPFIGARIQVEGKASSQRDFWQSPSMCAWTKVGNCANKAFLLTSLLRYGLPGEEVYCVFGNLHNGKVEGHAWVEWTTDGSDYIVESTRGDVSMVEATPADRYEPVHYFTEKQVFAIPGRTIMTPFAACFSTWLKDYLDWTYINYRRDHGQGQR